MGHKKKNKKGKMKGALFRINVPNFHFAEEN